MKHEIGRVLGSREDGMEYWNKYNEIVKEVIDSEECKPGIAEFVKTSSALSESALLLVFLLATCYPRVASKWSTVNR